MEIIIKLEGDDVVVYASEDIDYEDIPESLEIIAEELRNEQNKPRLYRVK